MSLLLTSRRLCERRGRDMEGDGNRVLIEEADRLEDEAERRAAAAAQGIDFAAADAPIPAPAPDHRRSSSPAHEEVLRRQFGVSRRFPPLEVIQLLDMDFSDPSSTFNPLPSVAMSARDIRVENNFWGAWSARCEVRGVKLVDRMGRQTPPIYAPTSCASGSEEAKEAVPTPEKLTPERMDLDDELEVSVVTAALCPMSVQSTGRLRSVYKVYRVAAELMPLTFGSKGPLVKAITVIHPLMEKTTRWMVNRGVFGVTSKSVLIHVCVQPS